MQAFLKHYHPSIAAFAAIYSGSILILYSFFGILSLLTPNPEALRHLLQIASAAGVALYALWLIIALNVRSFKAVLVLAIVTLLGIPAVYATLTYYTAYMDTPVSSMVTGFMQTYATCLGVNIPVALAMIAWLKLLRYWSVGDGPFFLLSGLGGSACGWLFFVLALFSLAHQGMPFVSH